MIDVSSVSYKVIAVTEKNTRLDITAAVQSLGWEENENELAMKVNFEVYNASYNGKTLASLLKIGCLVAVKATYGGTSSVVAYAKIVTAEHTSSATEALYKITAYDVLYDLQKSQDNIYFASGKKTSAIMKSIMKSWGVTVSSYKGPNVKHGKILYKNKNLADIILDILNEAKKKGGGKGLIRATHGKVQFVMEGSNTDVYVFTNENSISVSNKVSTANMITRVKIMATSKEGERAKIEATVNGKTDYGVRQKIVTRSSSEKLSEAKKEAKEILEDDGDPEYTRTIIAPDIPCIRKGDKVQRSDTDYIVTGIQHNADKGKMTMQVKKYKAKESDTSSSSSDKESQISYKVTAKSGLRLRKGPDASIITTIPYGTTVKSDGKSKSGWIHVKYNGQWGYSYSKWLDKQ